MLEQVKTSGQALNTKTIKVLNEKITKIWYRP